MELTFDQSCTHMSFFSFSFKLVLQAPYKEALKKGRPDHSNRIDQNKIFLFSIPTGNKQTKMEQMKVQLKEPIMALGAGQEEQIRKTG